MVADLDGLQRKLEALKEAGRRAEEQLGDFGRMQERISELQVSSTAPDRSVTVIANAGGVLDIQFTQDAMRKSPGELSSAVMSTLRQAVAEAARRQADIVQEYVPDSDVREQVLRTQEQLFNRDADRPRSAAPVDDEDYPDSFLDGGR
ncbi:YbaB/EbfC DNA-binding family protein [Saccharopolyspora kobensis]|uniref:YbaB/EbfC DNA-binding family protein n=1 Tax=Saccharopolyspora kobensis TaxID=146035 RepID=A0A1H6EFD8_9PSEU|nr:YbaB/EbfC family nucleoid-associated protein [Saccharopolyspora kobensis]SEG95729.1 YbaB/EbfC DNA-binding family protein [Saccharopolyspora kobensis]SFD53737.1 YbaB/EbfC DNA-binding family protein [Saccharopolyspora kobensis]